MTLQRQPSKTSCGPTCVAMIADVPVADVLTHIKTVRTSPIRQKTRTHRTNIGEMLRLLKPHGWTFGRRIQGFPPGDELVLVRVQHPRGKGWHWIVSEYGTIYDPAQADIKADIAYFQRVADGRVSYYILENFG